MERIGRVLRCAVSTGDNGASLNDDALAQAVEAISAIRDGDDTGCILLVGAGPNFCTGGDVQAFAAAGDVGEFVSAAATGFHAFLLALTEAPVPVVAAVHGWAAGAGMSIACAADLVVAVRAPICGLRTPRSASRLTAACLGHCRGSSAPPAPATSCSPTRCWTDVRHTSWGSLRAWSPTRTSPSTRWSWPPRWPRDRRAPWAPSSGCSARGSTESWPSTYPSRLHRSPSGRAPRRAGRVGCVRAAP